MVSITPSTWCIIGCWKSIIVDFISIFQKGIYILPSHCMHKSPTRIGLNCHIPLSLRLFNICQHMLLTTFGVHSNPPLKTVKLTVFEVIIFNENTELIPSSDSSDLYPGNNYLSEGIMLVRVVIPFRN